MASFAKNIMSMFALVTLMLGTVITGFGIFKTNDMSEKHLAEEYIIPSQVLNGLSVMFLLYLTSTSDISASYKFLIIMLLVGGMMIEIYLTMYSDRKPESIAAYLFISLNLLIRIFFLIELIQGEWVRPFKQTVKPIQSMVKDVIADVVEPPKVEEAKSSNDLIEKWDKLKRILESKSEGLDKESRNNAWRNVIRPAEEAGRKDIKEVLKEAVALLKDKSGNSIPLNSVDAVGGKRRS